MNKKLVYCGNLHVGGGVQVAVSFINELLGISESYPIDIAISKTIKRELGGVYNLLVQRYNVFELDVMGAPIINQLKLIGLFSKYTDVFVVFGPSYVIPSPFVRRICGFAIPMIAYQNNEIYARSSFGRRVALRVKNILKELAFLCEDLLIVELPHVRNQLSKNYFLKKKQIEIIYNAVSDTFRMYPFLPPPFRTSAKDGGIRIGYLTRDYPHKNIDFLVEVNRILVRNFNFSCTFVLTLSESEWNSRLKAGFCVDGFENRGVVPVNQCAEFYSSLDGVVFPSLLECFSVTPLEALVSLRPLFASDRRFVRDACGDYAYYFDPTVPFDCARIIFSYYTNRTLTEYSPLAARHHALTLSTPNARAKEYLKILMD